MDVQAGTDTVSKAAVETHLADEVVIVSEYDPLSTAGIERMKIVMGEGLGFDRTRVLLNKMLPEFVESFSNFLSVARYLPPIPWTADVVRAFSKRKLAVDFENGNEYTVSILQSLRELLADSDRDDLESWLENKSTILKEPITTQYDVEKSRLEKLLDKKRKIINYNRNRRSYELMLTAFLSLTTGIVSLLLARQLFFTQTDGLEFFGQQIIFGPLFVTIGLIGIIALLFIIRRDRFKLFKMKYSELDDELLDAEMEVARRKIRELEFLKDADSITLLRKSGAR